MKNISPRPLPPSPRGEGGKLLLFIFLKKSDCTYLGFHRV